MGLLEAHASLAGKVAVVVGGAGGYMGRGVTLALARAGVHVAACDNDDEAVRDRAGGRGTWLKGSVRLRRRN